MNSKSDFLRHLDGLFGKPEGTVNEDTALTDVSDWDSLAHVEFIALMDEQYGTTVSAKPVSECTTARDLMKFVPDLES
jgi:acyl carrier protein